MPTTFLQCASKQFIQLYILIRMFSCIRQERTSSVGIKSSRNLTKHSAFVNWSFNYWWHTIFGKVGKEMARDKGQWQQRKLVGQIESYSAFNGPVW